MIILILIIIIIVMSRGYVGQLLPQPAISFARRGT
jgi:hypothetical protein